jgi:excisionase family DNA binding protein
MDQRTTPMVLPAGATSQKEGGTNDSRSLLVYRRIPPEDCARLPINDAASYLGISRSTVYNLLNAKKIKSVRIGSRNVVLRSSCDEYLKSLMA